MRVFKVMSLAALFAFVGACGDDGTSLYIKPFQTSALPLTVGQTHKLTLRLSGNVGDTTYVDVSNTYSEMVSVDPMVFKFKEGEGTLGQEVTFVGLKATPAGGVEVVFQLRDSDEKRAVTVKVSEQGTLPDGGVQPDLAPSPDTGATLDIGAAPDTGAQPDAGMAADAAPAGDM